MSAAELLARLADQLPAVEPVVPIVFLDDGLLPDALALVEPTAFILASGRALWGRYGPRN